MCTGLYVAKIHDLCVYCALVCVCLQECIYNVCMCACVHVCMCACVHLRLKLHVQVLALATARTPYDCSALSVSSSIARALCA